MNLVLTGTETGDQLIKQLVHLRMVARRIVRGCQDWQQQLTEHKVTRDRLPPHMPECAQALQMIPFLEEKLLDGRFLEMEIGQYLVHLCPELDRKVSREAIFDAINTNKADRDTESVRKYGHKASHIICVLDLENSATKDDEIETRPLKWCKTMAFMNALQTNPKLDRIVHDGANEHFNGLFGDFQERPLTERLVGRSV